MPEVDRSHQEMCETLVRISDRIQRLRAMVELMDEMVQRDMVENETAVQAA